MATAQDRGGSSATMPSEVTGHVGFFDRFATATARFASRAWFFALCIALVVIWAPSIVFLPVDTWQLVINTATTIVTFLLVALLQNTQTRADAAVQQKLNAIADGLADVMDHLVSESPESPESSELAKQREELRRAVGLEDRESA